MSNPLVAQPVSSTTAFSGVELLEDAQSVSTSIGNGDWASGVLGIAGTAMDALAFVEDPFGSILQAGVGWLLEHVGPLKEMLDKLAGNPDQVMANAQTWQNVSQELTAIGQDLAASVNADLQGWTGGASDAYRRQVQDLAQLLGAASQASAGAASGVQTAGELVASVRALVRDTIAKVVAHMVSWALQVLATLGIALTWVVPQVVQLVAKTAADIAGLVKRLISALKTLSQLLGKTGKVFDGVSDALKSIKGGTVSTPTGPGLLRPPPKPNMLLGGATNVSRAPGSRARPRPSVTTNSPSGSGTNLPASGGYRPPSSYDDDLPLSPGAPYQPPYGGVPVPSSANDHVIYGNLKPPRPPQSSSWGFSGGHVLSNDLPAGTMPYSSQAPGAKWPTWHGAGVSGGVPYLPTHGPVYPGAGGPPLGSGPHGSYPLPNGVYELHDPTMTTPLHRPNGKPFPPGPAYKPMSTMFPEGMNPGMVQNTGGQAWNGGHPNGGLTPLGRPGNYSWEGQAQIPFTPIWDKPGGVPGSLHGDGSGNHPNAGNTINFSGYANGRPTPPGQYPSNVTPATYYPNSSQYPPRPAPFTPGYPPR
ncbi:WXG100-like domain-containing protein [Amycolatopsis sp. NPDC004368]